MDRTQELNLLEDAVDLIWDICEEAFNKNTEFHSWFISDIDQYFQFLKRSFARVINNSNRKLFEGIGKSLLSECEVDRVAIHYRSRRAKEDESATWRRSIFDLTKISEPRINDNDSEYHDAPHIDTTTYYQGKTLPQHIFKKGKRNRVLCFEFAKDEQELLNGKFVNQTLLRIPFSVYRIIAESLDEYPIQPSVEKIDKDFLHQLAQYCHDNLSDHNQPQNDQERIQFLIDSSLITLTLLKKQVIKLPRAFILVPVFVGQEGIGGMAFFSENCKLLQENQRSLKYLAMNLLAYITVLESHEIEAEKRILEANSPVVHLFVHSINKAFTTPIQNICTDIDQAANILIEISAQDELQAKTLKSGQRLRAISNFLSSFSERWSGAIATLVNQSIEAETEATIRFLAIDQFDGKNINQELLLQVQALFSVQLANEIFDFSDFCKYRPFLEYFSTNEGINKLVDLRFNVQHRIYGSKDLILLFLLELVQNAIEALPLGKVLWNYRDNPRRLKRGTSGFKIEITSQELEKWIAIEIRDNGSGFPSKILEGFQKYLPQYARTNFPPPTLREIRQQLAEDGETPEVKSGGGLSSKSGGAMGIGIFGIADYLSRICLVEWDRKKSAESDYTGQQVRIIRRGTVEIESPPGEKERGSIVRLLLPKEPLATDSKSWEVCLERRV
ncbi:MAG: hypothetical protein WBA93_34585 [Microcoleaceae cyanobacterium]